MDKKKLAMPIAGMIAAVLVILLAFFPILSMEPKDIPVGVISLDEGMVTPNGEVNAGTAFEKNIVKADNKLIEFTKAKSEKILNQDLKDGEYYAAIVIPKDFTKNSISENGKIDVTINEGINPMVTMQLSTILSAMGEQSGISFDIKSINSVTSLGIKAMVLTMLFVMATFIISLITAFLITINIKNENKGKSYLKQLIYIIIMAFAIGFTIAALVLGISGVDIGITKPALYLTLVSIALMLFANGSINLFGKRGLALPVLLFVLGIGVVQIPYEYLNGTWQTLIASWEPFRYIGNGIREVLYQGSGVFNCATTSIIVLSVIGLILSLISVCKRKDAQTHSEADIIN